MKVQIPDISQQDSWEGVKRFANQGLQELVNTINGNLSFSDNVSCQFVGSTFTLTNTTTQFAHGLNRVPQGYIVVKRSAAFTVYDGTTPWTATNIYLQSTAAGNATILVF